MAHSDHCIAVVDDDHNVLRSMERLFRLHGFSARTFASADSLLEALDELRPGCIVADVAMPGVDGLQFQQQIAATGAHFPIVFVTALSDVRSSVTAMRQGAVDVLEKPFDEQELFDAVERALQQTRAARDFHAQAAAYRKRLETLTHRERDVLAQIVEGLMNKQIAALLGIAEKTVKIHRARIMRKMGVRSAAQLARLAERFDNTDRH
jgi:FixJ family two-component response regulator